LTARRSTVSQHLVQQPAREPDVVERCLAHAPADKTRAAYNRHEYQEERRAMLQQWPDLLDATMLKARNVAVVIDEPQTRTLAAAAYSESLPSRCAKNTVGCVRA
jgi:hypothetical protein